VLLVGPYDPSFVEDASLAPPLGVWRLAGVLGAAGAHVQVFDPNCRDDAAGDAAGDAFAELLTSRTWHLIGFSTTGPTLRHDLALAHLARRLCGGALMVAGDGSEAALNAEALLQLGLFDLIVLGQGEHPLLDLVDRLRKGVSTRDVRGTAWIGASGQIHRLTQPPLDRLAFRDATFQTPYARMPFRSYWDRQTSVYKLHDLPVRAERDVRVAEVRAIGVDTLGAGAISVGSGCACSPVNPLNEAQGAAARAARLDADDCLSMVTRIASAWPDVRTIVFRDDIFVFNVDQRIRPLCEGLLAARHAGVISPELQFISTSRIDSMDQSRLALMKRAGFRVLCFGVESFSREMLTEFGTGHIWDSIAPNLQAALKLGITPFLDVMLTSPRCGITDVATNVATAFKWLQNGCEAHIQPYVIPFAGPGAALARDRALLPFTVTDEYTIDGTTVVWKQPVKILPIDPLVRDALLGIERMFAERLAMLETDVARLPSRVRSLLWIACAVAVLTPFGEPLPGLNTVVRALVSRLPIPPARAGKLVAQLMATMGSGKSIGHAR
jgi:hypothetical protein